MSDETKGKPPDLFAQASMHLAGRQMNEVVAVLNGLSCVAHGMRTATFMANVQPGSELDLLTSQLVQNVEASARGILMMLRKIDDELSKLFPGDGTVNPELPPTKH
jgi:hypothetical protein